MIKRQRPGKTLGRGPMMHGASPFDLPATHQVMHRASPTPSGNLPGTDARCIAAAPSPRRGANAQLSTLPSPPLPYHR